MDSIRSELVDAEWMTGALRRPSQFQAVGTRVYWLEGAVQDIFFVDVNSKAPPTKLVGSKARSGELTIEEEMERERTRSRAEGIDSFVVASSGERVLFRSNGKWYIYIVASDVSVEVFSTFDGVPTNVSAVDKASLCTLSFTCKGNVFIGNLSISAGNVLSASWVQITHIGGQNGLTCGEADYIIAEEFSRLTGHWVKGDNVLFTVSDQSRLKRVNIFGKDPNVIEDMPYPRVGDENPTVLVCNFNMKTGVYSYLPPATLHANSTPSEYLPRLGFFGEEAVYVQTLSRSQEDSSIVVVPLANFVPIEEPSLLPLSLLSAPKAESKTINNDHIPYAWVEITGVLQMQATLNGDKVNLLGKHATGQERPFFHVFLQQDEKWEQITSGNYNVAAGQVSLVGGSLVYLAGAHNYLGSALCLTEVHSKSTTVVSAEGEYVYTFTPISEGGVLKGVVFVVGTATECPHIAYYDVVTKERRVVSDRWHVGFKSADWPESAANRYDLVVPKIHSTVNARGVKLPFYTYTPNPEQFPGKRPVLMYVYGGPHVQLVRHGLYDAIFNPLMQAAVSRGVTCIIADNSMCHANDLKELSICKRNMGRFETSDYTTILKSIPSNPELAAVVDVDRVAISGWSYGGYATLLAMSQANDIFKLGFAGAPVGDWRLYDTGYTERYMGLLPADNDAYEAGSIPAFAEGFPSEPLRLFIAHGLTDENVHFANSCAVVDAVTAHGKPFQLQVYPGERHGLRQKAHSFNHYRSQMLATLLKLI